MGKTHLPVQETGSVPGWEDPLEKEMAAHFSTLAWKIPWTEEPGRLPSMGLQRVGHDLVTKITTKVVLEPQLTEKHEQTFWPTQFLASGPITSWQIDGKTMETVTDFIFLDSKITAEGDRSHDIKRRLLLGRKTMTNLDSILKKQRRFFADKVLSSQSCGFSSSHVWMGELDHKEG